MPTPLPVGDNPGEYPYYRQPQRAAHAPRRATIAAAFDPRDPSAASVDVLNLALHGYAGFGPAGRRAAFEELKRRGLA